MIDIRREFDSIIEDTLAEFQGLVDEELIESQERYDFLIETLNTAIQNSETMLTEQIEAYVQTLSDDNNARYDDAEIWVNELTDAYIAPIQAQLDNVDEWFGDRLEWIEELYDEVYKGKLRKDLVMFRDASIADL